MNKKLLIGFGVVLAVLVILPIAGQLAGGMGGASSQPVEKPPPEPPKWNSSNLVGTAWEVKTKDLPVAVTITLNSGGQAVATVPAMFAPIARQMIGTDTLTGNWSVNGAKLIASVEFQGKKNEIACEIIGERIFAGDLEIKRVR